MFTFFGPKRRFPKLLRLGLVARLAAGIAVCVGHGVICLVAVHPLGG